MTAQLAHPTPEKLNAFSLGQLAPEDAEAVEIHIDKCQPCCDTLLSLSSEDTFVALLQEVNQPPTDETVDQLTNLADSPSSAGEIPPALASHPRYSIVAPVGKGGMGDVFKAEHRMMERTVALKVIKRELFRNPAAVQRFHREVKSAAKLSHPNIVTAHDAEQAGDINFLVMEYVEGVDLARRVQESGALPIDEACRYIHQTALGLQHAHEQGMVHRDIKPHNLMVTSDGTLKILDFGLATLAVEASTCDAVAESSQDSEAKDHTTQLTAMGTMMGTPEFISPEQAGAPHAVDIRSDIYSLGCTFYYLLSGRAPFAEGSVLEKVQAHADRQAEPIENIRADLPREIADVVQRMLSKDPADRYQTPADVADALAPFVDAHRTRFSAVETSDSATSAATSGRTWWPPTIAQTAVGAALVLALGVIVSVATDHGTLEIESMDPGVEVTIRPASSGSEDVALGGPNAELDITDTVTGSTVKRLRSGEYKLDIKGDENDYVLSQDRFVLKRGDTIVVTVTKAENQTPSRPDLELLPEPWVNGESLELQIELANGLDIGRFVFSVSASQQDGHDVWLSTIARHIVLKGVQVFSRVTSDRSTFRPMSSLFRHPSIGNFEAIYTANDVTVTTANVDDGTLSSRTTELKGVVYDNEQSLQLFRRLPLVKGFEATIPLFATFAEGAIDIDVVVTAVETVEVSAGRFECYRLDLPKLKQTYWISTDEHRYPVKFEADGLVGTLLTTRTTKAGEMVEFREVKMGFALDVPDNWYVVDGAKSADDDDVSFHLLDPQAEATSKLVVGRRELHPELLKWIARQADEEEASARAWLEFGIQKRQKSRQNFVVRPDSWTERTVSGSPAISYVADYKAGEKEMVYYVVCSLGESAAVQFQTRIERDRFEKFQSSFDAIVDTYREEPK